MTNETPRILTRNEALSIEQSACPMLVLSDYLGPGFWGWFSKQVRLRTPDPRTHRPGEYSHAMWLLNQHQVATQGRRFWRRPLSQYVDRYHRVKFWWNPKWRGIQKVAVLWNLQNDLKYRGGYDYVGIFGRFIGFPGFEIPWLHYCSEEAGETLRMAEPGYTLEHGSPADLDRWCKGNDRMRCWGVYDPTIAARRD